jgi:hypothetical protein
MRPRAFHHVPVRPIPAESADLSGVTFTYETTDADGEVRVEAQVRLGREALGTPWSRGLASPRARERAWKANPVCCECHMRVAQPTDGGLIVTTKGHRIAHKLPCFVQALAKHHPDISIGAAPRRAEGH